MRTAVGIAVAGALGALARYGLDGWVSERGGAFPWGTFVVNVTGAFVLGFVFTVMTERFLVASWLRTTITIGFLGSYTTFSTFTLETFRLLQSGSYVLGALNGLGSLTAGLAAVWCGVVLGRVI
jgi:CrcB protein